MSNFESSSSFVAPVATTTRASKTGLRKTHNHRALTINTSPTYYAKTHDTSSRFVDPSAIDSDEEEERIRVNLVPIVDEYHYQAWETDVDQHDNSNGNDCTTTTAVNITVQLGIVDAVRDAFQRAKKTVAAIEKRSRQILPALTILAVFCMLVIFGATSTSTSSSSSTILAPSGRSMRALWTPPAAFANDMIAAAAAGRVDTPPSSVIGRRVARAASYTQKSTPSAGAEGYQPRQPVPLSPSPLAAAPAAEVVVASPPSGTLSAKFRLLYVYGEEQQQMKKREEHEHPDDLAALFNGGRHV